MPLKQSLSICLLAGALGMILTRVLSVEEAYKSVDWIQQEHQEQISFMLCCTVKPCWLIALLLNSSHLIKKTRPHFEAGFITITRFLFVW